MFQHGCLYVLDVSKAILRQEGFKYLLTYQKHLRNQFNCFENLI